MDNYKELSILYFQAELPTTSSKLDDLTRKASADNLRLRNELNVKAEAENRIHAMEMVERSHKKLLKETKAEVRRWKT